MQHMPNLNTVGSFQCLLGLDMFKKDQNTFWSCSMRMFTPSSNLLRTKGKDKDVFAKRS